LIELDIILADIQHWADNSEPILSDVVMSNVKGVVTCIQATWLWHVQSKRYKRNGALWLECCL